jgi:AcrR family transcriptional regulator
MALSKGQKKRSRHPARLRDSASTRKQLIRAVGTLLARDGFTALGVNAVAKEAGVDKVLIYRYFGGMPELLRAFGTSGEFWPSFEEMTGGDLDALRNMPLSESITVVMRNYIRAMRRRPLTQEILAWEAVERNELTRVLETIREEVSLRLFKELEPGLEGVDADVAAVTALLAAAVNYLVIRSRTIRIFNTVDIRSGEGWNRLEKAIVSICGQSFVPRKAKKK